MPNLSAQAPLLTHSFFPLQKSFFYDEMRSKRIKFFSNGLSSKSHCSFIQREMIKHPSISLISHASVSNSQPSSSNDDKNEINSITEGSEVKSSNNLLVILAVLLGIAVTVTLISIFLKQSSDSSSLKSSLSFPKLLEASSESSSLGFTFSLFGKKIVLPEHTPGWVYFWLLMAAGFGLFISEEALNVWVGISLARSLCLDGTWQSFVNSFSTNTSYIISTILWVYLGVCMSDMIPFYLGKLFKESKASEDIYDKLGIGKEKVASITRVVQNYGNLSGFIERFSLGVRNPTAFLAGACGISAECFFAGVCGGALITLSIQLAVGFLLRERPIVALASVAAFVGIWTLFPYVLAASTALFILFRPNKS